MSAPNTLKTMEDAKAAIQSLNESLWIFSTLNALISAGAFPDIESAYTLAELSTQTNMPLSILHASIQLLTHAGMLVQENNDIKLAAGLQALIKQSGRERFNASLCVAHGLSAELITSARDRKCRAGWHYTNEMILQSQGLQSQYIVTDCFLQDEILQQKLRKPAAVFLDVGAGVGQISLRACEDYPHLTVMALEPADAPYQLAKRNIQASRHAKRIKLYQCQLQAFDACALIDVAWFPHVFIEEEALADCLQHLRKLLKPDGMLITTSLSATKLNQATLVRQLVNALYGGLRTTEQVIAALKQAGYKNIHQHDAVAGYHTITATN